MTCGHEHTINFKSQLRCSRIALLGSRFRKEEAQAALARCVRPLSDSRLQLTTISYALLPNLLAGALFTYPAADLAEKEQVLAKAYERSKVLYIEGMADAMQVELL